jgi:hypothetical protein
MTQRCTSTTAVTVMMGRMVVWVFGLGGFGVRKSGTLGEGRGRAFEDEAALGVAAELVEAGEARD